LRKGRAEKILYTVGLHLDGLIDALVAGTKLRFPGYYSLQSLTRESRDARMYRGRYETGITFADRLTQWLDFHRKRGNPLTLLRMLHAHFAPNNFKIELIYVSGARFTINEAGVITADTITWTPPGDPDRWCRWWLFYHHPPFAVPPPNWDDDGFTWDNGQLWDSGLSAADVQDLKTI